jgi:hypothetical protein
VSIIKRGASQKNYFLFFGFALANLIGQTPKKPEVK